MDADVVFVVAKSPRWKEAKASGKDRLKMVNVALKEWGDKALASSSIELEREGEETYTYETIESFCALYPRKELILLIGADQAKKFPSWKEAEKIKSLARIAFFGREGELPDQAVIDKYGMERLDETGIGDTSSTAIRDLKSLDLPLGVLDYIERERLYFVRKLGDYLKEKRLSHSLSVARLSYAIAKENKLEKPEQAYVAGLLHDIGRELPITVQRKILKGTAYSHYDDLPDYAIHQFIGAELAKKEFEIEDEEVLDAIRYHSTGRKHMLPISKIVYSADKIEPGRGYDSSRLVKACLRSYYVGFLAVLRENRKFLKGKETETPNNRLSQECYDLYIG